MAAVLSRGRVFPSPNPSIVKRWECQMCGFIFDEARGRPEEGIPPGTRWRDVPEDWACPDCGTPKSSFRMEEAVV